MPKKIPAKLGRPPHEPTDETRSLVRLAAAIGLPRRYLYSAMKIHSETFNKYYEEDFENGLHYMVDKISIRMFKKAIGDEPDTRQAGEFLLKTRAGWTDKKSVEVTGKDGAPLIPTQEIDVKKLTPDAIQALKFVMQAAQAKAEAVDTDFIEGEVDD